MSAPQPHRVTTAYAEVFQAIVISNNRETVLAALTEQAVEHFGHGDLRFRNVRVSADARSTAVLASADISLREGAHYGG